MPTLVPQIRVFLASPGDVNEERAVVRAVLETLEYDERFRQIAGGVSLQVVAWDAPGSDVPMRATMTPQTAIAQGLPLPSACDIVLVLLWGRMGTPLPFPEYHKPDGTPYLSGTEWEYHDAVTAERAHGKPITLIYRRTEEPSFPRSDRERTQQYQQVLDFFAAFRDARGALIGGVNEYSTPEHLRQKLERHLRTEIAGILRLEGTSAAAAPARPHVEAPPLWEGSPFPGLHAFSERHAPIFFGRGAETSALVARIAASRFTAVIAASGSGKSSLVAAGVIPRLKENAIVDGETGSRDWRFVRLTPGASDSPFGALFEALCAAFPEHPLSPFLIDQERAGFIDSVRQRPAAIETVCAALLREANAPAWAEVLLFIDQFEELFTLVSEAERAPFIALLRAVADSRRLRCVVTMRSDFTAAAVSHAALAELINLGSYMLSAPTAGALLEMITRPAERAGLTWEPGLPERIQADTGDGAGALALMAFVLDELYHESGESRRLTHAAYDALGGVDGAIGRRAETAYAALMVADKERLRQAVFRELVTVDAGGTATRVRAHITRFDADAWALIRAFASARLLVTDGEHVEVAHEALFRSWAWLKAWIAEAQEDVILLRQVRAAAHDWERRGRSDDLLWDDEILQLVYAMLDRQGAWESLNESERAFIEPEADRLLRELEALPPDPASENRRLRIGDRLAEIGDPRPGVGVRDGIPDIDWLPVTPGGTIEIEYKDDERETQRATFTVQPFFVARCLITYAQYDAFVTAPDGFADARWWAGMPDTMRRQELEHQHTRQPNAPRDSLSWYQAVAFARWLDAAYRARGLLARFGAGDWQVRLPTEWEWEWMAQGGTEAREYPWGAWRAGHANTSQSGLNRTTAVGMYPHGAAACGALDAAGNLWEWCLNDARAPARIDLGSSAGKVLRGGSFYSPQYDARAAARATFARTTGAAGGSVCGWSFRLLFCVPDL